MRLMQHASYVGLQPSVDPWREESNRSLLSQLTAGEFQLPAELFPYLVLFVAVIQRAIADQKITAKQLYSRSWRWKGTVSRRTQHYFTDAAKLRVEAAEWLRSDSCEVCSFRWWAAGLGLDGRRLQGAILRRLERR